MNNLKSLLFFLTFFMACAGLQSCTSDSFDYEAVAPVHGKLSEMSVEENVAMAEGLSVERDGRGSILAMRGDGFEVLFDYTNPSSGYDMAMSVSFGNPEETNVYHIDLNSDGLAEHAVRSGNGNHDEWWFSYNEDGRMDYMKRSSGILVESRATYNSGDIVATSTVWPDGESSASISYVSAEDMIDNTGSLMLFDTFFGIPVGEMGLAWHTGILGKPTAHLPVGCKNDNGTSSAFLWTLDGKGFCKSLIVRESVPWGHDGVCQDSIAFAKVTISRRPLSR